MSAVDRKYEQFLYEAMDDFKTSKLSGSLPLALQVTIILIFCMHHILGQPGPNWEYVLSRSLRFTLKFCTVLAKVALEKSWSAFPVMVILMEWLTSQIELFQTFRAEEGNRSLFSDFCEKVVALDINLGKNMVKDLGCDVQMLQQDQNLGVAGKAQWEDHELLGFVPLASMHLRLDFSSQLPGYGISNLATYSCWRIRCTDALHKLWNVVGQNDHGCLPKMPSVSHTSSATEESNRMPSLKEWIEKTFFSPDLFGNLTHAKQAEVLSNQREAQLPDEAISKAHAVEHSNPCEIAGPRSFNTNVESMHEASTEIVMHCCQQGLEQDKESRVLEEQKVVTIMAVSMVEEISSTKANFEKVKAGNVNMRQEVCNVGCTAKSAKLFSNQSLTTAKSQDTEKEADFSFGIGLVQRQVGVIGCLHKQKEPIPFSSFDNVSHVKPGGFIEAVSSLGPRHLWNSSTRLDRQLASDKKSYDTQNPFVLRLRHLSR